MRLVVLCAFVVAIGGCGRLGFGESNASATPLVAEEAISSYPLALTGRGDGSGYAAAFAQLAPGDDTIRVVVLEVDGDGRPMGAPVPIAVSTQWLSAIYLFPSAQGYRVFYRGNDADTLHVLHVQRTGETLEELSFPNRDSARVTDTPTGYAVVYRELNAASVFELRVHIFDENMVEVAAPIAPVPATSTQGNARIAANAEGYGLLWVDYGPSPDEIFFTALDAAGVPRFGPFSMTATWPRAVHSDGVSGFIVAVEGADDTTEVMRYDSSGVRLWPEPYALPPNLRESQDFEMAVSEDLVGFAWQSDDASAVSTVDASVLSLSDGSVVMERTVIADGSGGACCPAVAANGREFGAIFDQTIRNRRGAFMRVFAP